MASLAFKSNSTMNLMDPVLPKVKKDVFLLEEGNPISGVQEEQLAVSKMNMGNNRELSTFLTQLRLNASKSWKPKLETIDERKPNKI